MILRCYGASVQSVDLNFDSRALTEIGFRRNQELAQPADAFRDGYERLQEQELFADAEGFVQDEVERELLSDLEAQVVRLESGLGPGEVLFVENEQGVDHPKTRTETRTETRNIVVDGENRLHFTSTMQPPLRLGVYRRRGASV